MMIWPPVISEWWIFLHLVMNREPHHCGDLPNVLSAHPGLVTSTYSLLSRAESGVELGRSAACCLRVLDTCRVPRVLHRDLAAVATHLWFVLWSPPVVTSAWDAFHSYSICNTIFHTAEQMTLRTEDRKMIGYLKTLSGHIVPARCLHWSHIHNCPVSEVEAALAAVSALSTLITARPVSNVCLTGDGLFLCTLGLFFC